MKSDTLRLMARELSEMVTKMPKLDWTQRESVRADLRRHVRRLLAKFCPAGLVGRRDATRAKASRAVDVSQRGVGSPLSAPTSRFSAAVVAPAPLPLPSASREFREPSAGSTPRAGAEADAADQLPHPLRLADGVAGVPAGLPLYTWAARARDAAASLAEKAAGCRRGGDDCNGRTAGGRMCA